MDLVTYLGILRRRWLVIALCLLAGLAGGFDLGHRSAKVYAATSQCLVNIPVAQTVPEQLAGAQLSSNLVSTYAELATSRTVAQKVISSLGLHATPSSVSGKLSATFEENTYLISISAKAATPKLAAALANAAATGLSDTVGTLGSGVNNQVSVQVVNKATVPTSPTSPRPKLDIALGGIFGLLAGLLLVGLIEALDRTVKSTVQADALLDAPHVGLIPRRRGQTLVLGGPGDAQEGEPYRAMRTSIRFLYPDNPVRTLLITSPTPGDGKTTIAANLAVALSLAGERVIVVDADLRRAALASAFGLERSVGLTTLVLGKAALDDVLQDWGRNLKVLASGPLPPNPSEILGSQLMNTVLADLAARADVVIIDAPPVLPVADAVALSAQVDAVVMVVRHGATLRHAVAEARRRVESVGATVAGYVLNAVPSSETRDYYADYRYESPRRSSRPAPPAPTSEPNRPTPLVSRSDA